MSFAVALFPVVLYIFVVYTLDNFSLVGIRDLMLLVGAGLLAAAACFGLFRLTDPFVSERVSDSLYPILEEAVKALPLWWLARRKKIAFFIDSVICGAAVGGGFSILENVLYLLMGNLGIGTALFRGLEVALIHMGCSAIVAVALMLRYACWNAVMRGCRSKKVTLPCRFSSFSWPPSCTFCTTISTPTPCCSSWWCSARWAACWSGCISTTVT